IAPSGKLVALLSVLASALSVALPDDGSITAIRLSDAAGGEHDVDRGEAVLDAVRMVLDSSRVHEETRLGRSPQFRRRANRLLGDPGHLGRAARRPLRDMLRDRFEAGGVLLDEIVIDPVVLDHELEDA